MSLMEKSYRDFFYILQSNPLVESTPVSDRNDTVVEGTRTIVAYSASTSLDPNKGKNWIHLKNFSKMFLITRVNPKVLF